MVRISVSPQRLARDSCDCSDLKAESSFILRRAELNRREPQDDESAMAAWSIRQVAVYSRLEVGSKLKSMFVLITPSRKAEEQLATCLDQVISEEMKATPWNVQRLLVGDSLRGWMDYMACLEKQLKIQVSCMNFTLTPLKFAIMSRTNVSRQSNRIVCAKVGSENDHLSSLTDFNITFIDRQELKDLEDRVLDLQVILPSMMKTVARIRDEIKGCSIRIGVTEDERYDMEQIIDEFEEYVREAETHVERAKVLQDKVKSAAKLVRSY